MKQSMLIRQGWNFAQVPAAVFLSEDLTHADVRLYCYLQWRAGEKDHAWPKVVKMADDLHMSEQAVRLSLRHLVEQDWIRRARKFGRSSDTFIFESQELCRQFDARSANLLEDDPLTGERMIRQQDSRLNESHTNENHKNNGAQKKRARDPLFDAICEVCAVDPATSGSSVGKVKATLLKADPPYTPEEVRQFGSNWWGDDFRLKRGIAPTLWQLKERIGEVRAVRPATPEPEAATTYR